MPSGLPAATTNDWPARKYGIMSTCLMRSDVMFWALMMMSHLPPWRAAMIVSKTEFWISGRQAQPLRDRLADLDVGADGVALGVEELLRRIGDVRAHDKLAGEDRLTVRQGRDGRR